MHWLELFVKWTPVVGPLLNGVGIGVMMAVHKRSERIFRGIEELHHNEVIVLMGRVHTLRLDVMRLKALAGMSLEDDE